MDSNNFFKIIFVVIFIIIYIGVIVYLGINFYFNTTVKKSWNIFKNVQKVKRKLKKLSVSHRTRFILSISFVLLNAVISVYAILNISSRGSALSTPFLVIFGSNMSIYFIYYGVRKIVDIWQNDENGSAENFLELHGTRETEETSTSPSSYGIASPQEKVYLRRTLRWFTFILFLISILVASVAFYFYRNKLQSRNMTPAESRERNELCG